MKRRYIKVLYIFFSILIAFAGCKPKQPEVDHIFFNGTVYTVDSSFSTCSAFAVKEGKIYATGSDDEILKLTSKEKTDLEGRYVLPGLHDGHCHFYGYGVDLNKIWLAGTDSYEDVLDTLQKYENKKIGNWIFGRGWDHNDWKVKKYPDNSELDSLFPDTPVILLRIAGHTALLNSTALKAAGIDISSNIPGGYVEKKNGKLTGIVMDAAIDLIYDIIPEFTISEQEIALLASQEHCFKVGLTSVTDAGILNGGLNRQVLGLIDSLQTTGDLLMRINAMASIDDLEYYRSNGPTEKPSLTIKGFKVYADGALGSRGACLLEPYSDQPGHYGLLVHTPSDLDSIAKEIALMNFQMNTHCIGDSSHRLMLKIYQKYIQNKPNHRWRIEHAQVINLPDLKFYRNNSILPSVQPTHATSDMYWAVDRLGAERIKGAYAYQQLLNQNNILISGSDFPVESINPFLGLYAAIARKDLDSYPDGGFEIENKLTREQAIRSFTIWPAYGSFTENIKGTIEKDKLADFIVIDKDIMNIPEREIADIAVLETYISGKRVYHRE